MLDGSAHLQSVFTFIRSFRLCHKLRLLHHPRQLGEQLAAAELCRHWHRELVILHQSVLLLSVRARGTLFKSDGDAEPSL